MKTKNSKNKRVVKKRRVSAQRTLPSNLEALLKSTKHAIRTGLNMVQSSGLPLFWRKGMSKTAEIHHLPRK